MPIDAKKESHDNILGPDRTLSAIDGVNLDLIEEEESARDEIWRKNEIQANLRFLYDLNCTLSDPAGFAQAFGALKHRVGRTMMASPAHFEVEALFNYSTDDEMITLLRCLAPEL
eukprot:825189_1